MRFLIILLEVGLRVVFAVSVGARGFTFLWCSVLAAVLRGFPEELLVG